MRDPGFFLDMLQKGREARDKSKTEFGTLSLIQLNWRPVAGSWSIGQCLDHLLITDRSYFPVLKKISAGNFKMSSWEKWSPFTGLIGHLLTSQIKEKPGWRFKAPRILVPSDKNVDTGILEQFHQHFDPLLDYVAGCSKVDPDKLHITSPVIKLVTYSLRRAIMLIMQHEHRHINQAITVKTAKGFPAQ